MSNLPQPSEVNADNIIKPSLDELSEEHRQAYEALKKQREEAFEVHKKKRKEEDLEAFLASFKKDRQGNITPIGEIRLPPPIDQPHEITESQVFSPEQLAVIESLVSKGNVMAYNSFVANANAQKNMPPSSSGNVGVAVNPEKPNPTLPISSAPPMQQQYNLPMNFYPSQTNQLVAAPAYPNPIMSVPNSASTPNYFVTSPMSTSMFGLPPNYVSAPSPQVALQASTQVAPMPLPQTSSSTPDPILAKLREDLHKMFQETFRNEPKVKSRVYQKPYPEHFDAVLYPPGYKVPDFVKFSGEGTKTTWEHVS